MLSDNYDEVKTVISDIESGRFSSKEIIEKYGLSSYKYYKILDEYGIKNSKMRQGPKGPVGPKNTPFKKLLSKSDEAEPDPSTFNLEGFKKDCGEGMKIVELMDRYNLSLYQVRELRKKYDLKSK